MAAHLRASHGVEAELVPGRGGVFEVKVDGAVVFSKRAMGRFPEPGELAGLLARGG